VLFRSVPVQRALWGDDQREGRGDDHATRDSTHVY